MIVLSNYGLTVLKAKLLQNLNTVLSAIPRKLLLYPQ